MPCIAARAVWVPDSLGTGVHALNWDLRDDTGRLVSSGVYIVSLDLGGETLVRKVVVCR